MHKHFQKPKWFYAQTYGSHLSIAHMIFIDFKKMYEKTPRKILRYVMKTKGMPRKNSYSPEHVQGGTNQSKNMWKSN